MYKNLYLWIKYRQNISEVWTPTDLFGTLFMKKNMFYLLCLECVKVLLAQPRIQISVQVRLTKQAQIHTFPLAFFENSMKNQLTFFLPLWLILFSLFRVERKCFAIHWESRSQLSIVMSFSTEVLENCNNLVCVLCFLL